MPQSTDNALAVALAFAAMQSDRVDVVGVGDSNQLQGGHGWDHGFQYALSRRAYMYATGLVSARENNGSGAGTGYGYAASTAGGASTGAPAQLAAYALETYPHNYFYGSFNWTAANDFALTAAVPLGITEALTGEFHYGTVPVDASTHTFQPAVRYNDGAFENITLGSVTDAETGSYGMARADVVLAANAARTRPVAFRWATPGGGDVTNLFGLWWRVVNAGRGAGFSYHTLAGLGGYSARDIVDALRTNPGASALAYWAGEVRRHQGTTKRVVFVLNSGLNDRGETLASLGPVAEADGDSAAAYADNCQAFIHEIREVWRAAGWSQDELYFVLLPSHRISDPDDAELIAYRTAAAALAARNAQTVAVDLSLAYTAAAKTAAGHYASGGADTSHQTAAGYEAEADWAVGQLLAPLAVARNADGYPQVDVVQVNGLDADPSAVYTQQVEGNTIRASTT